MQDTSKLIPGTLPVEHGEDAVADFIVTQSEILTDLSCRQYLRSTRSAFGTYAALDTSTGVLCITDIGIEDYAGVYMPTPILVPGCGAGSSYLTLTRQYLTGEVLYAELTTMDIGAISAHVRSFVSSVGGQELHKEKHSHLLELSDLTPYSYVLAVARAVHKVVYSSATASGVSEEGSLRSADACAAVAAYIYGVLDNLYLMLVPEDQLAEIIRAAVDTTSTAELLQVATRFGSCMHERLNPVSQSCDPMELRKILLPQYPAMREDGTGLYSDLLYYTTPNVGVIPRNNRGRPADYDVVAAAIQEGYDAQEDFVDDPEMKYHSPANWES